jgi:coiled-coil domain-containing protein 130
MQGFNMGRYYPPDASNAPTFNTTHPLGARAKKASQGILTVRFELPFAVWCNTCKPTAIIGQGVRFNAEKKKVGNYYSTPIWSFRMKHTACGGWWEIRTDPKSAEYVVVEGARRRDYGPEDGKNGGGEGDLKFLTEEEREKRRSDAFAQLEGRVEEKGIERGNKERVEELYEVAEVWKNPYDVNARLRKEFRVRRKVLKKEEKYKEGVQEKFSLGIELLDETEADGVKAKMVEFGAAGTSETLVEEAARKPLFSTTTRDEHAVVESNLKTKKLKSEIKAENSRINLQQTLVGNTRAIIDPFLSADGRSTPKTSLGLLKRKRDASSIPDAGAVTLQGNVINETTTKETREVPAKRSLPASTLVDYDSD